MLASQYGRYGYKKIAALLQIAGWSVGRDRVEGIWRREGRKVPKKQRPRRRLWLNDGSCIRLRTERANHVWGDDFVSARTHEGRLLRILALIDEAHAGMFGATGGSKTEQSGCDRDRVGCDAEAAQRIERDTERGGAGPASGGTGDGARCRVGRNTSPPHW